MNKFGKQERQSSILEPINDEPTRIEELQEEIKYIKKLLFALANYTGQDNMMRAMGAKKEDMHQVTAKETKRDAA